MTHGAAESGPVVLQSAVQQEKAAALGGEKAGGEASTHRQPAQADGEYQLHQHGHPEGRQGIGAQSIEATSQVNLSLGPGDSAEANAQPHHSSDSQGDDAQFQAGGQGFADGGPNRLLVDQGLPQIAMDQSVEIAEVLIQQRLIQAQPSPHGGFRGGGSPAAEHRIHWIPWGDAQQQEHQAGDQPQHQWRQGEAGGAVAGEVSGASHQFCVDLSERRFSSASINWPLPSNCGGLRFSWAQARGESSQTGM